MSAMLTTAALASAVAASGAETVWLHHGYAAPLARFLAEGGRQTRVLGDGPGAAGVDPGPAAGRGA